MTRPTYLARLAALALALALFCSLTACGPASAAAVDTTVWEVDLGPALERARAEGKDLLVDFTGSDWCGWCIKLHDEVFGQSAFVRAVQDDFVLVALDFPREGGAAWDAMTPGLRARNRAEAQAFGVGGFPTVLLMSPEGVAYGRTGYRRGGVAPYVEHLQALRGGSDRAAVQQRLDLLRQTQAPVDQRLQAARELLGQTAVAARGDLDEVIRSLGS